MTEMTGAVSLEEVVRLAWVASVVGVLSESGILKEVADLVGVLGELGFLEKVACLMGLLRNGGSLEGLAGFLEDEGDLRVVGRKYE